jgi:hypothetical protein
MFDNKYMFNDSTLYKTRPSFWINLEVLKFETKLCQNQNQKVFNLATSSSSNPHSKNLQINFKESKSGSKLLSKMKNHTTLVKDFFQYFFSVIGGTLPRVFFLWLIYCLQFYVRLGPEGPLDER